MRAGRDDVDPLQTGLLPVLRQQGPEPCSGSADLREDFFRQPKAPDQLGRPVAGLRVVDLSGAGETGLGAHHAAETVIEIICNIEERVGRSQRFRIVLHLRDQLVKRVDRHKLDAGLSKDGLLADLFHGCRESPIRPRVTVVESRTQQRLLRIEQGVVHAPTNRHSGSLPAHRAQRPAGAHG